MAVKASIRKPVSASPLGKPAPVIDVDLDTLEGAQAAKKIGNNVDETSADELANALEAGVPVPGSDEEVMESCGTRAVATRPGMSVASGGVYAAESDGGLEGDFDSGDLKLPQLKIVNGSGPLSQKFNQGSLIYADELLWMPPDLREGAKNPMMQFVPLKVQKQYRENLTQEEMEEGLMPRIVNTRQDAEELGGSTQWVNNQKPRWSPSARCIFLLRAFEGCEHPGFCHLLDDKNWALAVYYASGVGYSESAKVIFNAAQISLKENGKIVLPSKVWTFQVTKKKAGNYTIFVPSMKLTKEVTGPEVREMASRVCGARTVDGE